MEIYTTSEARAKLYKIVDQVASINEPIYVKGRRNNAVIISEKDYNDIQETLFLLSIPNMRESIRSGMLEDIKKSATKLNW